MCKIVHNVQNSQNPSKCPKCTNCTRCTDYYCIYSLNLIEKPQKNKYLFYWRLPLLVDDLKSRDAKASTKVHMASLLKNFNPSQFIFNKKNKFWQNRDPWMYAILFFSMSTAEIGSSPDTPWFSSLPTLLLPSILPGMTLTWHCYDNDH